MEIKNNELRIDERFLNFATSEEIQIIKSICKAVCERARQEKEANKTPSPVQQHRKGQ